MRLAILSDIHGNPLALDAVLADIQSQGEVDAYWVLGDFTALGYDPVTPLEKVTALSHASFTRGNTDRYVVTQDLPVQPEKALQDPSLLPEVIERSRHPTSSFLIGFMRGNEFPHPIRASSRLADVLRSRRRNKQEQTRAEEDKGEDTHQPCHCSV